jgi:hypothetical protein
MFSRLLVLFGLMGLMLNPIFAQQEITIGLNDYAKDDRFDRLNLNLALFELTNDTMLTWDFEGLRKAKSVKVIKPDGFKTYAYGFVFFAGNHTGDNPGFLTVLVGNPYHTQPTLFADLNSNNNFTDDNFSVTLPWRGDTLQTDLCLSGTNVCARFKFTRHLMESKQAYKELMNEFYQLTYPNRKFIGMDNGYRTQQYQVRSGIALAGGDSIRVGLFDANNNGIYNEPDTDRFVLANLIDTVFYPFDDLYGSTISKKNGLCFIDKNGKQFEFVRASKNGDMVTFKVLDQTNNSDQIKVGKKLPRFKYITWKAERKKISKLKKYQLYIYFGSPQASNFAADTAALRVLANDYEKILRVIGFIEVNKSYELSIFGQYSYLNWILAYKNKDLNKKLGIRGLPSSIYTKKRRRVVKYNLTPNELLQELKAQPVK